MKSVKRLKNYKLPLIKLKKKSYKDIMYSSGKNSVSNTLITLVSDT